MHINLNSTPPLPSPPFKKTAPLLFFRMVEMEQLCLSARVGVLYYYQLHLQG